MSHTIFSLCTFRAERFWEITENERLVVRLHMCRNFDLCSTCLTVIRATQIIGLLRICLTSVVTLTLLEVRKSPCVLVCVFREKRQCILSRQKCRSLSPRNCALLAVSCQLSCCWQQNQHTFECQCFLCTNRRTVRI